MITRCHFMERESWLPSRTVLHTTRAPQYPLKFIVMAGRMNNGQLALAVPLRRWDGHDLAGPETQVAVPSVGYGPGRRAQVSTALASIFRVAAGLLFDLGVFWLGWLQAWGCSGAGFAGSSMAGCWVVTGWSGGL